MAYGLVNVPGVSGPEMAALRTLVNEALDDAAEALESVEAIKSLFDDEIAGQLGPIVSRLSQAEADIAQVKDALFTNITGNPFTLVFSSLEGFSVTAGVYNAAQSRLEC